VRRTCGACGKVLEVADELMQSIKAMSWIDRERDEYTSVEIDGWVLVWDENAEKLLAACSCARHLMPHHFDGPVVMLLPDTAEKA
jgi:hypothetical protein